MTGITRQALFGRLDATCYRALESATGLCRMRGHAYVELAHWLQQIEAQPGSDLARILAHFEADRDRLRADLLQALDALPRASAGLSDFSAHIEDAAQQAWLTASLGFGSQHIRSGHLLLAALRDRALAPILLRLSKEFGRVRTEVLAAKFEDITANSPEAAETRGAAPAAPAPDQAAALAAYTLDLTARASAGKLDPVIGRDTEMRRVIDVLMRRRQNNPLLTGEAGVGKTAVVEGLALRIAAGDVPPALRRVRLLSLDLNLLQAGAGVRGEFEQRMRQVIDAVQAAPQPVILFVDEVHGLIGAGGREGTGDAANILKPALARGELRTIGATTWSEYKRYIEKDPALSRRFQAIPVAEPEDDQAIAMMRRTVAVMEAHHGIEIRDEAVEAAVTLSRRYLPGRRLPDKALSLLDTACARVGTSRHAKPEPLLRQEARRDALRVEREALERERWSRADAPLRMAEIEAALGDVEAGLAGLESRWREERALVLRLEAARCALRADATPDAPRDTAEEEAALLALQAEHDALARESPLVLDQVDRQAVAAVLQDWTGIPVQRLLKDEAATLLTLPEALGQRVIGQDHALEAIARRVQTSRAGLEDPGKPIGVFLLCGPSGVGKTETALALAESVLGGEDALITINMSEYQEAHTVSGLKGAPPGYVGYGQGGVLTEAVRRRPHAVILLDEIEKAHPDVHKLFFQVFDKGVMEDGEGSAVDFRSTVILATCNIGSQEIADLFWGDAEGGEAPRPEPESLQAVLHAPLRRVFPPALLGRMVVLPYFPLSGSMLERIARMRIGRVQERLRRLHGLSLQVEDSVFAHLVGGGLHDDGGGRRIDAMLTEGLLPQISRHILAAQGEGRVPTDLRADVVAGRILLAPPAPPLSWAGAAE